jgi:hypothetical protein
MENGQLATTVDVTGESASLGISSTGAESHTSYPQGEFSSHAPCFGHFYLAIFSRT